MKNTDQDQIVSPTHSFPVIRRELANQVLWDQLFQHFGDAGKVRFIILEFDSIDQSSQLKDFLSGAFVVTTKVFGKLLDTEGIYSTMHEDV